MREILFRGKNPVSDEWAYGSLILEKNAFDERLILANGLLQKYTRKSKM